MESSRMEGDNGGFGPPCLSADPHGGAAIHDQFLHYMGCLEFCDREAYFETLNDNLKGRINGELRRIEYLRDILTRDEEERLALTHVQESLRAWRQDEDYASKLAKVQRYRENSNPPRPLGHKQRDPHVARHLKEYSPDTDMAAYLLEYDVGNNELKSINNKHFTGDFPSQRIAVSQLLDHFREDGRPLSEQDNHEKIRYFHLPANNMQWVEKAMCRYFDEEDKDFNQRGATLDTDTKASTILRPQYWRGQQHGGKSTVVHARHLRPLCETISSDPKTVEESPNNLVFFMPYLHWETDRRREAFANFIESESAKHEKGKADDEHRDRERRKGSRGDLLDPGAPRQYSNDKESQDERANRRHAKHATVSDAIVDFLEIKNKPLFDRLRKPIFKVEDGRIRPMSKLGQVLLDAARLYEVISTYRDKSLIRRYLHSDPPLHPRRTLDQAYYWTLTSTKVRDRDQVVYRGTRPDPKHDHKFKSKKNGWSCHIEDESSEDDSSSGESSSKKSTKKLTALSKPRNWHRHGQGPDKAPKWKGCANCSTEIQKVARVVMVDQLWMWILDKNTIITFFPKRYGINKQDHSGVHRSIRDRLQHARAHQIRSAFDIALIIIDECSNTFFDRTKTEDLQPRVMDIFSEAIGIVTNRQTTGFKHFWYWAEKLSNKSRAEGLSDISKLHEPLLDINPEGLLQREIKDIIDELDIMIHITKTQMSLIKKFKRQVEHIFDDEIEEGRQEGKQHERQHSQVTSPTIQTVASPSLHQERSFLDLGWRTARRKTPGIGGPRKMKHWFKISVEELLLEFDDRLEELQGMRTSGSTTEASLDHLLSLKQQQASIVQALQAVQTGEEAVKQGRAIMIITVITIIFLPLSFMATLFGMNNVTFQGSNWTLGGQVIYIFPISFGIILVTVIIAFSSLIRAIISSLWQRTYTFVVIKSGAYEKWLQLRERWASKPLMNHTMKKVHKMKYRARRNMIKRQARRRAHAQRKEEEEKRRARPKHEKLLDGARRMSRRVTGMKPDPALGAPPEPAPPPHAAAPAPPGKGKGKAVAIADELHGHDDADSRRPQLRREDPNSGAVMFGANGVPGDGYVLGERFAGPDSDEDIAPEDEGSIGSRNVGNIGLGINGGGDGAGPARDGRQNGIIGDDNNV